MVLRMLLSLTTSCGMSPGSTGAGFGDGRGGGGGGRGLRAPCPFAEVGADDAAAGAGAGERREVDALRFGQAAGERAGLDAVAGVGFWRGCGLRRELAGFRRRLSRAVRARAWALPSSESRRPCGAGAGAGALSPSPLISAIGVPTFTPSMPSATRIWLIVPSSTASNSIVALSVSISASRSPDLTVSPSLTSHLASVPSSIVGDKGRHFEFDRHGASRLDMSAKAQTPKQGVRSRAACH